MTKEEALEVLEKHKRLVGDLTREALETLIPELKDEKKEIIQFLRDASNSKTRVVDSQTFSRWADYLERTVMTEEEKLACLRLEYEKGVADTIAKYEEQKQEWSKDDERIRNCLIRDQEEALKEVRNDKYGHSEIISDKKEMYRERIDWLKSLRPKKENSYEIH